MPDVFGTNPEDVPNRFNSTAMGRALLAALQKHGRTVADFNSWSLGDKTNFMAANGLTQAGVMAPPMRGTLGEITEGLANPSNVMAGLQRGTIYDPNRARGGMATTPTATAGTTMPPPSPGSGGFSTFPQAPVSPGEPGLTSRFDKPFMGTPIVPERPFPYQSNFPADKPMSAVAPGTPGKEAGAVEPASNEAKALGQMTFATGLNMLAKASQIPDFRGQLGALGTTFAGMAQMTGKGGKWAMPVAVLSTLTYLAGERGAADKLAKDKRRLARAYGRALAAAGGSYGK